VVFFLMVLGVWVCVVFVVAVSFIMWYVCTGGPGVVVGDGSNGECCFLAESVSEPNGICTVAFGMLHSVEGVRDEA